MFIEKICIRNTNRTLILNRVNMYLLIYAQKILTSSLIMMLIMSFFNDLFEASSLYLKYEIEINDVAFDNHKK